MGQRGQLLFGREEGGKVGRTPGGASFLRLRGADLLASDPLAQHHKGITNLEVGTSDRDMALVARASHRIGMDSSTRYVMDLLKTLPGLPDNVLG